MPVVVLAPIAVLAIAILCLLLVWAFIYLVQALENLIPNWGIPGLGNIRSAVGNAAQTAYNAITWMIHEAITPLENVLAWPVIAVKTLIQNIYSAIGTVGAVLQYIYHVAIPDAISFGVTFTTNEFTIAEGLSYALYNQLAGILNSDIAIAEGLSYALYNQLAGILNADIAAVETEYHSLFNTAERDIANAITGAAALANSLFNTAEADIVNLGENILNYIASVDQTLLTDIANAVTAAEAYAETVAIDAAANAIKVVDIPIAAVANIVWPGIIDDVTDIQGIISTDFPDINALWAAIPKSIPLDIASAITASLAIAVPIVRYMKECGVPMCQNLHGLSQDIQALTALFDTGAIVALLVAAASDPVGTGDAIYNSLGSFVSDTVSTLRDLIGI